MNKRKDIYSAEELLAEKFGARRTKTREKFREEAFANYFADLIKERRKKLKMTQEDLAKKIGKKRPYVSRIEKGHDIKLSNFSLLAHALDLSIEIRSI
jgi:ribosome-binding protein aMBF1 (putative translation factor)